MLDLPSGDEDGQDSFSQGDESASFSSSTSESATKPITATTTTSRSPSSPTNSPSQLLLSWSSSPTAISELLHPDTNYPDLVDWLASEEEELVFCFNKDLYQQTCTPSTGFFKAYVEYVNSNFKITEELLAYVKSTQIAKPSTIGLITTNSENEKNTISRLVDDALVNVVQNLSQLIETPVETDEEIAENEKLQDAVIILKCFESTFFNTMVRTKPEIIMEWVNRFDPQPPTEIVNEVVVNEPQSYLHPLFWKHIISKLAMRGLFKQLDEILQHADYKELEELCNPLFTAIEDFRNLMSMYSSYALNGQFARWKLLACEYRDSLADVKSLVHEEGENPKYQIILSQLYDIACLISGMEKTIAAHSENWYDMYLALSLYQIRDDEEVYKHFFEASILEKPPPPPHQSTTSSSSLLSSSSSSSMLAPKNGEQDLDAMTEECLLNILKGNLMKALETVYYLSPATAAYLSLFMDLKNLLEGYYTSQVLHSTANSDNLKKTASEYFLTRHAYNNLDIHELVPVGIGLLANPTLNKRSSSKKLNLQTIASFLPHYNVVANEDLEWALTVCADLGLTSTARDLYFQAGLQALENGYLYEALNNFVNCYDPLEVSGSLHQEGLRKIHYVIWEIIFTDSLVNNSPIDDELINNIVDGEIDIQLHPIIQQSISPYAVLKEYFSSLSTEKTTVEPSSLSKIIHLLKFQYMPKKFRPLLLGQFLLFLRSEVELQIPDLIIMIELIDNYEGDVTGNDKRDGEQLFAYSVAEYKQNIDSDGEQQQLNKLDWREDIVPSSSPTVDDLLALLRRKVSERIAKVFIE